MNKYSKQKTLNIFILLLGICSLAVLWMLFINPIAATSVADTAPPQNVLYDSYLLVIDPGHGGNDSGTQGGGNFEKDVTLDICLRLNDILKNSDIHTYMVRNNDTYVRNLDRIRTANEKKASIYLSVHCDWFKESSYHGIQTLYNPSTILQTGNLTEKDYAEIIQKNLVSMLKGYDRGLKEDSNLTVTKFAEMPSVLVEIGFLSNKDEASKLSSPLYRQKAAEALAKGIEESLQKIATK